MLHITANPDCIKEHKKLEREKESKPAPSIKNLEGEGNRKDGEGQRGELLQDGRGRTSGERAREQDRDSRETTLNVPFSIFEEHGD